MTLRGGLSDEGINYVKIRRTSLYKGSSLGWMLVNLRHQKKGWYGLGWAILVGVELGGKFSEDSSCMVALIALKEVWILFRIRGSHFTLEVTQSGFPSLFGF